MSTYFIINIHTPYFCHATFPRLSLCRVAAGQLCMSYHCVLFFLLFFNYLVYLNVLLFWKSSIDLFCVCIFPYFWTYVWLYVFFLSLFPFFKITRFLLISSTMTNTKITCIIIDFTIIIWLMAKILLVNYNTKLMCFDNAFTSFQYNDITQRVVMFPWLLI